MLPEDIVVRSAAEPVLLGVAQGRADPLLVEVCTLSTAPHFKPVVEGCAVGPPPAPILLLLQPKPMVSFAFIAFNEDQFIHSAYNSQ